MTKSTLVIVASGSGSRLEPIHQNCYPKLLVNLDNTTLVEKLINSFVNSIDIDKIYIIIDSYCSKKQIQQAYLDSAQLHIPVEFIVFDKKIGTAKTIKQCIYDNNSISNENVIITWSDIYPLNFYLPQCKNGIIFVDINPRHRVEFKNNEIIESSNNLGNIPGIFYFKNLDNVFNQSLIDLSIDHDNEIDITYLLQQLLSSKQLELDSLNIDIVDTGDLKKYEQCIENSNSTTRYFNTIEIDEHVVHKKAIHENGMSVIQNELEYYKKIHQLFDDSHCMPFPKLLSSNHAGFSISKIKGKTVHELILNNDNENTRASMYYLFKDAIYQLHKHTYGLTSNIKDAVRIEYFNILWERLLKINSILPVIKISNDSILDMQQILHDIALLVQHMSKHIVTKFTVIHGDPNTSNAMIDENYQMVFIDPRGCFGNLNGIFGDPIYDHAKFLYGLTGYSEFNLDKDVRFTYDYETKSIYTKKYNAPNISSKLDKLTDDNWVKFIVAIIWLKLPYYTINNLNKSIVSYAIGLELCKKYSQLLLTNNMKR